MENQHTENYWISSLRDASKMTPEHFRRRTSSSSRKVLAQKRAVQSLRLFQSLRSFAMTSLIVFVCFIATGFFPPLLSAETAFDRLKKKQETGSPEVSESLGNFIAIKTGQVKDGEQIPLPVYQDGKKAVRKEVYYLVSPAEIPTSLSYVTGIVGEAGATRTGASGTFYIRCVADEEGVVRISLWQQAGTGEGTKVVGSDTYRILKESFKRAGVTNAAGEEDDENVVTAQMRVLSERLVANYMVIAIRSPKK